jgi:hypothetical protein
MGDDGTPRTVQPGSVIVGNTAIDGEGAGTYRITNNNKGKLSWTCNADHILVLQFNEKPSEVRPRNQRYRFSLVETNAQNLVVQGVRSFATQAEADEAHEQAVREWTPLIWQGTVHQFLQFSKTTRRFAQMYQPSEPLPFQSSEKSLQQRLTDAFAATGQVGRQATLQETELTAWVLGMWLTDGAVDSPVISQIALDVNRPDHSHTAVILQLESWYSKIHGAPVASGITADGQPIAEYLDVNQITWPKGVSMAGNVIYDVRMGKVLRELLKSYGILNNKQFPTALLADEVTVRQALLAGVVDGDGWSDNSEDRGVRMIEVAAKERRFIDGLVHLARGLGFSTGKIDEKRCTDEETGEVYKGCRVYVGGENLHKIQTALMYKRFSPRPQGKTDTDQSCDGFTVEKVDHAAYYGFTLDGNGRCLLGDFTVTHNSQCWK